MLSVRNLSTFIKLRHNRTFQNFFWKSAEFLRWTRTTPSFPRKKTGFLYKLSILRNDKDVIRGRWGSRDSVGNLQCAQIALAYTMYSTENVLWVHTIYFSQCQKIKWIIFILVLSPGINYSWSWLIATFLSHYLWKSGDDKV